MSNSESARGTDSRPKRVYGKMTSVKHPLLSYALASTIALSITPSAQARPSHSDPPTLAWVLKQHMRAMGTTGGNAKLASTEHSIYTLSAAGLDGSLEEYTAPPKFRVDMTLGPLHEIKADDGLQGWEQDSTGNVRIVRGPELTEERAETDFSLETYDPLSGRAKVVLHPHRDPATHDYIIDATPDGGTTQTLYLNPKTFLTDKMVVHEGGIEGAISILGYRSVNGVMTPTKLQIGYAGLPVVVTADLQTADYGKPIDKALFRMPATARDFEFLSPSSTNSAAPPPPPGTTSTTPPAPTASTLESTTIPFTSQDAEIILPVTINGHQFHFLLDSGAGSSFITGGSAKVAGLTSQGSVAAVGYGGTTETGLSTHTVVDVGNALRLKGQLLYVIQDPRLASTLAQRANVDGALGYDVFARMTVRIDYPNRLITFSAPGDEPKPTEALPAPPLAKGREIKPLIVPIKLENHTPTISAAVDGRKAGQFLVDTGDNGDIHLYSHYAAANKLVNTASSPNAVVRTGVGVGGSVSEVLTPGHRIEIGGTTVKDVTLATMHSGGIDDLSDFAGGIGNGILCRYAVTFDYADSTLRFDKSTPVSTPTPSSDSPPPPPAPSRSMPPPPPPAPVSTPPAAPVGLTLTDLLAKHLAALGGEDALDKIEDTQITASLSTGGIDGTVLTAFKSPSDEYEEDKLGIMEIRQGYNGKDGWRADGNGNERALSDDEVRDLKNQLFFDTNSYVLPGRLSGKMTLRPDREAGTGDYVVDVLPDGGKPATIYFDPASFMIAKEQHKDDDELTVTTFSDYRPFDGVMFPTKQHITNGTTRYDIDLTVQKIENNVALASDLFDPPNRQKGYAFVEKGATSATVPFKIDGGEIGFEALIDGHKERLLFDSGASSIAIDKQTADSLKLKQAGVLEARGYGGSTDLHPVAITSFEIPGAIRIDNITGVAVNVSSAIEGFLNDRIAGFVGYDLLSRFVIKLDYEHKTLTFIDPSSFTPTAADGEALDIQLDDDIPSVKAAIDHLAPALFIIDTGDFSTLRMYEPYISNNKLKEKYKNGVKTAGGGIAGVSESLRTRIDAFDLGPVTFNSVPTEFSLDTKGGTSDIDAGSIGAGILQRFIVTFDFPDGRIYLAPARKATRPFPGS